MTDPIRYVVRQYNWLAAGKGVYVRAPGERRIAWFDDPDAAAADRFAREQRVRDKHNPFSFGPVLHYLTTFPLGVFRDWLMDDGIEPPEGLGTEADLWRLWWDEATPQLSRGQRERVWEGLNRVRFYDVISRKDSEIAFAVVRIVWDYDDCYYHAGHEGGEPLIVYRSKARAEAERERLERREVDDAQDHGYFPRDPEKFLDYGYGSNNAVYEASMIAEGAPQFEVVEIDLREVMA